MRIFVAAMVLALAVAGCGKKKKLEQAPAEPPKTEGGAKGGAGSSDNGTGMPDQAIGTQGGSGSATPTGGGSGSAEPMVKMPSDDGGEVKDSGSGSGAHTKQMTMPAEKTKGTKKTMPSDDGGE